QETILGGSATIASGRERLLFERQRRKPARGCRGLNARRGSVPLGARCRLGSCLLSYQSRYQVAPRRCRGNSRENLAARRQRQQFPAVQRKNRRRGLLLLRASA